MGDHTEAVQIDFDPARIRYEQLLKIFWESHDPSRQSYSEQYKNAVFFHTQAQKQTALASAKAYEKETGKKVKTQVVPLVSFTLAEPYHQKYLLKHHAIKNEMRRMYPLQSDLLDSTAAARVNGYIGGYGTKAQLLKDIDSLGLSTKGKELLLKRFSIALD